MPVAPYIPPQDGAFDGWLLNFSTLITANPTDYGLVAGDATAIAAQYTAFNAAYVAATDPVTRTPVTVAAKDTARFAAEAVVRPYAQQVANDPSVSDALKTGLGLNLHGTPPTPIPAPVVAPSLSIVSAAVGVHRVIARNPDTPTSKKMPPGVIGVRVYRSVTQPAPASLEDSSLLDQRTKQPMQISTAGIASGVVVTYRAAFVTRSGPGGIAQVGPMSDPVTLAVL